VIRKRRPADHRNRARRWHDAVANLTVQQAQYAAWLDALPANLQDSTVANALQQICDLDLDELQAIDLPSEFGRDRCPLIELYSDDLHGLGPQNP